MREQGRALFELMIDFHRGGRGWGWVQSPDRLCRLYTDMAAAKQREFDNITLLKYMRCLNTEYKNSCGSIIVFK